MSPQPPRTTAADLLAITEVERLTLGPDDALVFKCPVRLTEQDFEQIRRMFEAALPGVKILILEDGADVSVLHAPGEQP